MFFLAGAASSVLDLLGSLQGVAGASSAAGAAASGQGVFNAVASVTADGGATSGTGTASNGPSGGTSGCWSSPETMSALLGAQGQSGTTATGSTGGTTGSDVLGTIEQWLASLENQLGGGQAASGGAPDAVPGEGGRHAGGIALVPQAFVSQPVQDAISSDGSTTASTFTTPFVVSSDTSATSTPPPVPSVAPFNQLERLIHQRAEMLAAVTAGQIFSTMA